MINVFNFTRALCGERGNYHRGSCTKVGCFNGSGVERFNSFDYGNLLREHAAFPALNIMLTCWEHNTDVDRCLTDGFDIDMDYRNVKDSTVEKFHAAGLKVGLWTANTKEALDFCLSKGVDYIESDVFADADGN